MSDPKNVRPGVDRGIESSKWSRGEEDRTDASDREAAAGAAKSTGATPQFGDRGGRAEGSGASGSDDERFRHQEKGGINPGDSLD